MNIRFMILALSLLGAFLVLFGCAPKAGAPGKLEIAYEKYTLDNGLDVALHEDRSDPIVAVALLYHVGSNREEVGLTGFCPPL